MKPESRQTSPTSPIPLIADPERAMELRERSRTWPSWDLSLSQLCDLELLLNGAYAPLKGYLTRADYERVRGESRLSDGTFWPFPIVLDLPEKAAGLKLGTMLALRDQEGGLLAALHVEDVWRPDPNVERSEGGSITPRHPYYVGGWLEGIQLPIHYDFAAERRSPLDLRKCLDGSQGRRVLSYQTDQILHVAERDMIVRMREDLDAELVIQPVVASLSPGDPEPYLRIRCYRKALKTWPSGPPLVSLLPLLPHVRGPQGILLQAVVARNYGSTHLLISASAGAGPEADEKSLNQSLSEIGITVLLRAPSTAEKSRLSPGDVRRLLAEGRELPEGFTFSGVEKELQRSYPPRHQSGLTLFFTGLSGSGKSTTANVLLAKLLERGGRPVTLLDGDLVRKNLSSELTFSKEHRDLNIRRIGYVASEITKHGGIAICCPIAPYDSVRREVRAMVERVGGFLLIHMSTPIEVCESRDRKGLYAKARAGLVQSFTGISDPYEAPSDAEIVLDAASASPQEEADRILSYLESHGYVKTEIA